MIIHLCIPRQYLYEGISFEVSGLGTPWPLRADGGPRARAGRGFYAKIGPWLRMNPGAREAYRVGGGCETVELP